MLRLTDLFIIKLDFYLKIYFSATFCQFQIFSTYLEDVFLKKGLENEMTLIHSLLLIKKYLENGRL